VSVCQLGCSQCADGTAVCIACNSGFTQDANDGTKCDAVQSVTSTGTVCPDGSFSSGTNCTVCSPTCKTCNGATSNDCIVCAAGQYLSNGNCVLADSNGVCAGSNLIADNNKDECDSKWLIHRSYLYLAAEQTTLAQPAELNVPRARFRALAPRRLSTSCSAQVVYRALFFPKAGVSTVALQGRSFHLRIT
jgi:hypothetical protein